MTTTAAAATDPRAAGFVRDICENPGDDAVRMIYADWLDDNGQPERGEFIRVQCELAKYVGMNEMRAAVESGDPKLYYALCRRERELLKSNWSRWEWGIELFLGYDDWTLMFPRERREGYEWLKLECRRGFVERATGTCTDWLAHGPAIVAAHPVTRVELSGCGSAALMSDGLRGWMNVDKYRRDFRDDYHIEAAYHLPERLWDHLPGVMVADSHWKFYADEKSAADALSLAAVNFARHAAGLPDLPAG